MMDLKIVRSRWARAGVTANGFSRMLNGQGNMCCLGFLGRTCGYSEDELRAKMNPSDVVLAANRKDLFPKGTFSHIDQSVDEKVFQPFMSSLTKELIATNDSHHLTEKDREEQITRLMMSLDVIVTFVD